MKAKINVIRFIVAGKDKQFFNYIPITDNAATKVNICFVLYLNQYSRSIILQDKDPNIVLCMKSDDSKRESTLFSALPIDNLKHDDDFIDFSVSFKHISNSNFSQLDLSLSYIDNPKRALKRDDMFFNTSIPVLREY